MDTRESTENQRIYQRSTHAELRGEFHGPINLAFGGYKTKRTEILEWISTVPYTNRHQRISDDRLAGTGEWILKKMEYRDWRASARSMLLLLRGIPGAGKTYIASQVIDWCLSNRTAESKLAYFYCNRAEESRRDPESILRTLIQQLAQTPSEDELLTPVLDIYNDREKKGQLSSRLTLKECQDLLIQLMAVYPETTICIDALDEVDHKLRFKLLGALRHVVERSNTLVKIFSTTRMDIDILVQFEMFPRIELEPDDNVDDINRFVKEKVQEVIEQKRLLHGNVANALKDEICKVLCERSKGMFQLAALQITLLCDMLIADDVRNSLKVLPETLADAYGEIYKHIRKQKGSAPRIALNAFRWVQCSCEPLQSKTLLDAITVQIDGSGRFSHRSTAVRATDLLQACQNLLILDKRLNVFRFAHLSVEEYLETQLLKVDSHTEIAKICLSLLCSSRSWTDYDMTLTTGKGDYHDRHLLLYSAVFWPWHLNLCENSCQILDALWEAFVSEATFQRWINYHCQRVSTWAAKETFWLRLDVLQRVGVDRLSTVCVLGLRQRLTSVSKTKFRWTARIKAKTPTTFIADSAQRGRMEQLLLCASNFGDLDIAQHLLDAGADASVASGDELTPRHIAADNRYVVPYWLFVDRDVNISPANGYGRTADRATNLHKVLAWLMVDRRENFSSASIYGLTPLHVAAANQHELLARLLVDRGANISAADRYGQIPLHVVARNGNEALAQLLLDRGTDISTADSCGQTPLHVAATNQHETLVRLLLDRGANISAVNGCGQTPLHVAAINQHESLARLLVDREANISAADDYGRTPLHVAVTNQHEALAQLLVDQGANISAADGYGQTPLHVAARNGHKTLALLLVDRGANTSVADSYGQTPLHVATRNENEELAWQLADRGADVSAADDDGWTPLHAVARSGYEGLAQLLIDRGADVSAAGNDGGTPLHAAAWNRKTALAWLLVNRGADISAADRDGWTPLHAAAWNGHDALVRLLVDRGAGISATTDGRTPLHIAAENGHEALARLLVDRGADLSAADDDGWTPLYSAVRNGHKALAQHLVDRGADTSVTAGDGRTPLHSGARADARRLAD